MIRRRQAVALEVSDDCAQQSLKEGLAKRQKAYEKLAADVLEALGV